jgi:inosine/xanthosine triphosphate pyrophosphatase family protein
MISKAKIVVATKNQGKVREYQAMLYNINYIDVWLLSLDQAGIVFYVD